MARVRDTKVYKEAKKNYLKSRAEKIKQRELQASNIEEAEFEEVPPSKTKAVKPVKDSKK